MITTSPETTKQKTINTTKNKFQETQDQWKAHDDWQFVDHDIAWEYFFNAGFTAALPPKGTTQISTDDLNTIHKLLFTINPDKEGGFFICEEAADLLEEVNTIINNLI